MSSSDTESSSVSGVESNEETDSEIALEPNPRLLYRRSVIALHTFTYVCALAQMALTGTPGHVTASYRRQRANFDKLCWQMKEALFVRSFRMQYDSMRKLYAHIADALYRDPVQARRGSGEPIYPALRLAMTLRWLAGGSYLDISVLYGVSPEGFYDSLWLVLECLVRHPRLRIQFDMRPAAVAQTASGFLDRQRKKVFKGAAGALDGMIIKIK